ncbi:hypothetical protein D1P53_003058 [Cryptococcus gattii VGV]|nr:hypothetical protein D1P53_003058 [Cryptococcus gattii VGV]
MAFDHQGKPIIGFDDSSALPIIGHTSTGDNIYGTLHSETTSQPGTGVFLQEASVNLDSVPLEPPLLKEKPLNFLAPVHDCPVESYCKMPGPAPATAPDIAELNNLLAGLLHSSQAIVDQSVTTTNHLNEMYFQDVLLLWSPGQAESAWKVSVANTSISQTGSRFTMWLELYGKRAVSWDEWKTLLKTHLLTRGWEQKLRHKFMLLCCLDTTPTAFDSFFHLLVSHQAILCNFEDPLSDVDVCHCMLDGVDGLVTHCTKAVLRMEGQTVLTVKPAD